ncbi:MAG TPA: phenylalanine--tRNA ligase subunit beta [Polyangiaceae bacterium]|jgi:phenylalanyl-tRNA synthetase beta chain|nr:phenylalanine--tRNA ligase subunit beta [Polyangiaceae bacterium]
MKASVRWLRELCPSLPDDPSAIAVRLTSAGLEVEATHAFGLGAEACVVAAVVSSRPHPSRSGLRLVTVDRGRSPSHADSSHTQEVVCGAPNVPEPGGLVVLAPLGAHLPAKGMTIERRAIAGVQSEGMLCSEAELGLGDDGEGILVLPPGTAAAGTPLAQALPAARDTILELGVTPNRPDALGHRGLAREAAALFDVLLAAPSFGDVPGAGEPEAAGGRALAKFVAISIEDAERCPHYGAAVLVDVKVGPSPLEVRWRLSSLGVRPISNVVDVTNLVMLEFGHPMHAFDLDRVRGRKIVVRRAQAAEPLRTLDGVDRTLDADDLVIADGDGPVALAGVMGGGDSEITQATRRVLLECAYFDARGIRRAARRHGIHTESSHRFERGVDWGDTHAALARASSLVARLGEASPAVAPHVVEARPMARRTVVLRPARLDGLLGVAVPPDEAHAILRRLGFMSHGERAAAAAGTVNVRTPLPAGAEVYEIPSFRPDVAREVDLIEEVARVRGYDAIPATLPAVRPSRDAAPREGLARRARGAAVALGLSEAITYSFVSAPQLAAIGAPEAAVVLRNPMSEEQSVMRTSLVPGLLQVVARARRHGERDARVFSVGPVFLAAEAGATLPEERLMFAAVLAGDRPAWLTRPQGVDVWDAKGVAEGLVQRLLGRAPSVVADALARDHGVSPRPLLHPRGAASIVVAGKRVGGLGPLHPDVGDAFEIGEGSVVVEIDLEALQAAGAQPARFVPLPRFPASSRDVSLVVRDDVPAGEVEHAARDAAGDLAEEVALFDRFVGGNVPAGHASLALHVVYRAPDRTLTDADVDTRHAQVVAVLEKRFGASLRGA